MNSTDQEALDVISGKDFQYVPTAPRGNIRTAIACTSAEALNKTVEWILTADCPTMWYAEDKNVARALPFRVTKTGRNVTPARIILYGFAWCKLENPTSRHMHLARVKLTVPLGYSGPNIPPPLIVYTSHVPLAHPVNRSPTLSVFHVRSPQSLGQFHLVIEVNSCDGEAVATVKKNLWLPSPDRIIPPCDNFPLKGDAKTTPTPKPSLFVPTTPDPKEVEKVIGMLYDTTVPNHPFKGDVKTLLKRYKELTGRDRPSFM